MQVIFISFTRLTTILIYGYKSITRLINAPGKWNNCHVRSLGIDARDEGPFRTCVGLCGNGVLSPDIQSGLSIVIGWFLMSSLCNHGHDECQ